MAITLNGTTGITTPDLTSEAGLTVDGVSFASGAPANTLVTTSGGNVGVGTSSPGQKLEVYGTFRVRSATEILDISAPAGKIDFNNLAGDPLGFSIGSTERMRIDSAGRVTMPYQPFFFALNSGTGSQSGDGITSDPFQFVNAVHNRGNGYNTSTHRFTAPISGVYSFGYNPGYKQTSLDFICRIKVNGVYITDGIRLIGYPSSHSSGSYSYMRYLSEGDYIELSSQGTTYHRNAVDVPNWFSGILLG